MSASMVGGVPFDADGTGYVLRYSVNALITLEEHFDMDIQGVLGLVEAGGLRTIRTVFWAGLLDHKPGISHIEAGEVMTAVGIEAAPELVTKALMKAFPSASAAGVEEPHPQKAAAVRKAAGTGSDSSPAGAD